MDSIAGAKDYINPFQGAGNAHDDCDKKSTMRRAGRAPQCEILSHRDPIALLPNRRSMGYQLAQMRACDGHTGTAVVILDIERFHDVNASLGRAAGDALLREVDDRLRACIPEGPS